MQTVIYPAEETSRKNFYPTPNDLAALLLDGPDWAKVGAILEPSAGKGDLVRAIKEKIKSALRYSYSEPPIDLDCIEIDPDLQHILTGKEFRVIHDDFLTFQTFKVYDAIIMNPPFDHGAGHLLKALRMQERGGYVACILNEQTIKNPCTLARQQLVRLLDEYQAEITYHKSAFSQAERRTNVGVAIIKVNIPKEETDSSSILDGLRADRRRRKEEVPQDINSLIKDDVVEAAIDSYSFEVELGCRLIREFRSIQPILRNAVDTERSYGHMLELKLGDKGDANENEFIKLARRKYWSALFSNPQFTMKLTCNLQTELHSKVNELADYDFSFYNIMTIKQNIEVKVVDGIHRTIMELFDEWTRKYSYYEGCKNTHMFNGWKTNDAFAVNKRVIIPYMDAFCSYSKRFEPRFNVRSKLSDIEKVFDFLSGRVTQYDFISPPLQRAEKTGQTSKIQLKYFKATFYKKGTCHLEFTDLDVLHKFNLYAAKDKNWLPPSYGKKTYAEMDAEEKAVIDSFEGEWSYNDVMNRADYFLSGPSDAGLPKLGEGK